MLQLNPRQNLLQAMNNRKKISLPDHRSNRRVGVCWDVEDDSVFQPHDEADVQPETLSAGS